MRFWFVILDWIAWLAARPLWYRWGYHLAEAIGFLAFYCAAHQRRVVFRNIAKILGPSVSDEVIQRYTRLAFEQWAKSGYELFCLPGLSRKLIRDQGTIEGWQYLESALATGKGVIIISAHCGPFFLASQLLPFRGIPTYCLQGPTDPVWIAEYITNRATRHGLKVIKVAGGQVPIAAIRVLRQGQVLIMTIDWDPTNSGPLLDFLGLKMHLPDGHIRLCKMSGAPILPCFAKRLDDNQYRLRILPPIEIDHMASNTKCVHYSLEYTTRVMECFVQSELTQWTRLFWHDL